PICCEYLNSFEMLHTVEELIRKAQLPRSLGSVSIEDQGIRFINHQYSLRLRLFVRRTDVRLCLSYVRTEEITSSFDDKLLVDDVGDMAGHVAFSGSARPVEKQRHGGNPV